MIRVGLDRLLDARAGRMWSGGDAMAWHPTRTVLGLTLPRSLTSESLGPLASLVERLVRVRREAQVLVLDLSRVLSSGCDEPAMASFQRFVVAPLSQHPTRVRQAALVGGSGLSQCALIGAVVAARPDFPWAVYPRLDAALAAVAPQTPPWVGEVVGAINSELTPLGLVSRVRAIIGDDPGVSLREVARRLSLAPRSLQRALERSATTFHDERMEVRLELAASRLTRTDEKVTTIAREAGYASLPHFLGIFRARFDLSPTQFRARHASEGRA